MPYWYLGILGIILGYLVFGDPALGMTGGSWYPKILSIWVNEGVGKFLIAEVRSFSYVSCGTSGRRVRVTEEKGHGGPGV